MKHEHKRTSISGLVTAVFARRFVVEDKGGAHLADLGSQDSPRLSNAIPAWRWRR
jgi:hypothetical protein